MFSIDINYLTYNGFLFWFLWIFCRTVYRRHPSNLYSVPYHSKAHTIQLFFSHLFYRFFDKYRILACRWDRYPAFYRRGSDLSDKFSGKRLNLGFSPPPPQYSKCSLLTVFVIYVLLIYARWYTDPEVNRWRTDSLMKLPRSSNSSPPFKAE